MTFFGTGKFLKHLEVTNGDKGRRLCSYQERRNDFTGSLFRAAVLLYRYGDGCGSIGYKNAAGGIEEINEEERYLIAEILLEEKK